MAAAAALLVVALVADEPVTLRNAPSDTAASQAVLWRGDWLEVRGEAPGFLKVYDHRHERPGYVRPGQVRMHRVDASEAPALRAVVSFLRDASGMESLGIGYAALYLRAAPAGPASSDVLDAIGTMADRLASRASRRSVAPGPGQAALAGAIEVAQSYGVKFTSYEREARTWICYDGEMHRRLLADAGSAPIERARAALSLTRAGCADPSAGPVAQREWNKWRVDVLGRVDAAAIPADVAGRVRLRRAEVQAFQAFERARSGEGPAAESEERAVRELALCDRTQLAEEDRASYDEIAVRVSASRWASEPPAPERKSGLDVELGSSQPGETCVRLVDRSARLGATTGGAAKPLAERCTFGHVWPQSVRVSPRGETLTLAVQPLPSWTELWIFRRDKASSTGWRAETLAAAPTDPDAGVVEAAGFTPDGARLLVAREAWFKGQLRRRFEVLALDSMKIEIWSDTAARLKAFSKWSSPSWKSRTLALR